jgi:hypothetical protein
MIVGEPHLLLMLVFVAVLDGSPQCSQSIPSTLADHRLADRARAQVGMSGAATFDGIDGEASNR